MTRQTISCRYCGGQIGPHWQVFDHITCKVPPQPEPTPEPIPAPEPMPERPRQERPQFSREQIRGLDMMKGLITQYHRHRR